MKGYVKEKLLPKLHDAKVNTHITHIALVSDPSDLPKKKKEALNQVPLKLLCP